MQNKGIFSQCIANMVSDSSHHAYWKYNNKKDIVT